MLVFIYTERRRGVCGHGPRRALSRLSERSWRSCVLRMQSSAPPQVRPPQVPTSLPGRGEPAAGTSPWQQRGLRYRPLLGRPRTCRVQRALQQPTPAFRETKELLANKETGGAASRCRAASPHRCPAGRHRGAAAARRRGCWIQPRETEPDLEVLKFRSSCVQHFLF